MQIHNHLAQSIILYYTYIEPVIITMPDVDLVEVFRRIVKYVIEGSMVAIAAYAIPKQSMKLSEITIIGLTAAATFSVLDVFLPSMAGAARSGAGTGIGMGLIGGLPIRPM